ncbi:reverse transcriptase domain-containing protein [Tanacetum coccineum]|uniref:Reverse transcriptase domain-containing protein n=1 Tax=Tanacetum coccineum TaxID=301880 RepID=A0ABQ5G9H0_9ASTR
MVDIPVQQEKPVEQRPPVVDTIMTLILEATTLSLKPQPPQTKRIKTKVLVKKYKKPASQVDTGELDSRVTRLVKTVNAMSRFNLPEAIDKSVKAHLKNILPKDVPDFGMIKLDKAAKKSMPKYSTTPFDQAALYEFDQKDKMLQMMRKSNSYSKHPIHKALFDALALSLSVDEDNMDRVIDEPPDNIKYLILFSVKCKGFEIAGIIRKTKDIYSDNIMDGINIDDLTIKQYLRLTLEHRTHSMVKKVDDMTIAEYVEYEERIKRKYNRNFGSYFPTYFDHCTSSNNTTLEFPHNIYFNPISPNTKFNHDSKDMELDEETGYTTDEESIMSEHEAIDPVHAVNTQSFKEELSSEEDLDEWTVHKNKQIRVAEANLKCSFEAMDDTINNDSLTSNSPSLEELNPRSFLLPFTINNYNSYDIAYIDASNNIMPRSIYEYLKLANLRGAAMLVKIDDMTQQETLETVENVLVKINKFDFPCDFVVIDMPENLGEMIILERPFLETIHAQIDLFQDEISLGNGKDRIKFEIHGNLANLTFRLKKFTWQILVRRKNPLMPLK